VAGIEQGVGAVSGLLYPLCFAASLVLAIAAGNPGQYRPSDLAVTLAAVLLVSGLVIAVVFLAVWALDRTDRAAPLAAAVALLAIAWIFYYIPAQQALSSVSHRLTRDRIFAPLAALPTLAAITWLLRQTRPRLLGLSRYLTTFGLLLLTMVTVQVVVSQGRGPRVARRSTLVRELASPLPIAVPPPPGRNAPPRDIYLIVLDGHANARVLQEVFGFDNSRFEDSLRALGFLIPRDARSNYVQTYLSVSSLLNFSHVTRLAEDAGTTSTDHSLPKYLIMHNRAARFLKAHGYRYVLFPSAWWAATAASPLADREFDSHARFELGHEVRRTELRLTVLRSTLLRFVLGTDHTRTPLVQHFLRSFEAMGRIPADTAPTFTFAHVLLPHVPYLVDERCRPLEHPVADDEEADTPAQRADYIGQVQCADRLVLELVTTLLRQSPIAPVILIVGDHGSRFADVGFYGHPERVSTAFIRERFGAFGAFYLPAGGDSTFREPVTLVNVLRNVFRYYFGADLPRAPDEMYVSGQLPYRFYPVDPRLLEAHPAPARRCSGSTSARC
jgi:hypothetical protein